jgi:hypothetical protein
MRLRTFVGLLAAAAVSPGSDGVDQAPRRSTQRVQPAELTCPFELGVGVTSKRRFCDVAIGRDPAKGIVVKIPPHRGEATLTFDLHTRHTYSAAEVKAGRGFAQYVATIGVLTADGALLARGVIEHEVRTEEDLFDRVRGDLGPDDIKAVAPAGSEPIVVEIPDKVESVSLLGERLGVTRLEGSETLSTDGRLIASVSNVVVRFQPSARRR